MEFSRQGYWSGLPFISTIINETCCKIKISNTCYPYYSGFPGDSDRDRDFITVLKRSFEEGNGYPLQYSCLENSMDRAAWQETVHGVAKNQTRVSDYHTHTHTHTHTFLLVKGCNNKIQFGDSFLAKSMQWPRDNCNV